MNNQTAVISCIIRGGNDTYKEVSHLLKSEYFTGENYSLYELIESLGQDSKKIDIASVCSKAREEDILEAFDIIGLVEQNRIVPLSHAEYHAKKVREQWQQKQIQKYGQHILQNPEEVEDYLQKIKDLSVTDTHSVNIFSGLRETMDEIEKRSDGFPGLKTGFSSIDDDLLGLRKGQYILLAARPSVGKTALVLNMAVNMVMKDKTVLFITLEQPKKELIMRMLATETEINGRKIQRGKLNDGDWERLKAAITRLTGKSLYIFEPHNTDINFILSEMHSFAKNHNVDCIFLDYIQLISTAIGNTRQQEIESISRKLKSTALDIEVPLVCVSQLSRALEKRGQKAEPILADLRDSGALEQDADIIIFLHQKRRKEDIVTIYVAKNRNGRTSKFNMEFTKEYLKFRDLDNVFD